MHENKVQSCLTLSVKKLEKKLKYYGTANFNRDHQYNFSISEHPLLLYLMGTTHLTLTLGYTHTG